jgi:DNA-binding NtrC family response regulator
VTNLSRLGDSVYFVARAEGGDRMGKILVVDDDRGLRKGIALALKRTGHSVVEASNGIEGKKLLLDESFDLMITDLEMPGLKGIDLLKVARESRPETITMVISGFGTIEKAVEAMKEGAQDFITKGDSFSIDELEVKVDRLLKQKALSDENRRLSEENRALREAVTKRYQFKNIIGKSPPIQDVFVRLEKLIQDGQVTVLIRGDSGTGKELVARAIHFNGPRKSKPFVTVNCAAIPDTLLESELFGHEKGAFTDAIRTKIGKFEAANGGSIFLDEIGELSLKLQIKLLRVLQEKSFERVGGNQSIKVDVRVIAATNKDLEKAMTDETFRPDLYYRLNVVPVYLPPLRERREDIPLLVEHFVEHHRRERNRKLVVAPETLEILLKYDWPGNIRELENLIEQLVVLTSGDMIEPQHLPPHLLEKVSAPFAVPSLAGHKSIKVAKRRLIEDFERRFICAALDRHAWNVTKAAAEIGESREGLHRKIKRYKIQRARP